MSGEQNDRPDGDLPASGAISDPRHRLLRAIAVVRSWDRRKSALLAALLVTVTYADVIFLGATLSQSDTYNIQFPNYLFFQEEPEGQEKPHRFGRPKTRLYGERDQRAQVDGISDAGGAVWQSEPGALFMRHVIRSGESPYWNPYSGAGSLGPETLVDIKFSPLSILHALLGGGSLAFNFLYLLLSTLALYFLVRTCVEHLGLTHWAALAGAIVYLLNGYSVANLASNVSQVYLYVPLCLYCIASCARRPSTRNFVLLTLATAVVWCVSFLPTTMLTLTTLYTLAIACAWCWAPASEDLALRPRAIATLRRTVLLGSAAVLSFLLLALQYFPIIESFDVVDAFSMYRDRVFMPATLTNLLSFFTPKHFWESYNAIDPELWNPEHRAYIGHVAFHFGIVSALVAANLIGMRDRRLRAIRWVAVAILLTALGRIFAIPGPTHVIDLLPKFRSVGAQYWWIPVAITMPLVVAWGAQGLLDSAVRRPRLRHTWLQWTVAAVIVGCFVLAFARHGWPDRPSGSRYVSTVQSRIYVGLGIVLLAASLTACEWFRRRPGLRRLRVAIPLLLLFELTFAMNHIRYVRHDYVHDPPEYVTLLRERIGRHRILNIGGWGLPPEYGAAFQIQQLGSMNMNILPDYLAFFQTHLIPDPSHRWGQFATLHRMPDGEPPFPEDLLDLLGVRYVFVPLAHERFREFFAAHHYSPVYENTIFTILENPDPAPRIFAVDRVIEGVFDPRTSPRPLHAIAHTEDPRLVERCEELGIAIGPAEGTAAPLPASSVEITEYGHARVVARASLDRPAVVILMDNWHPNWRVEIDGEPGYIGRVNRSFRGLALPAGDHQLVLRYRPSTLDAALGASGLAAASLVLLWLARRRVDRFLGVREGESRTGSASRPSQRIEE